MCWKNVKVGAGGEIVAPEGVMKLMFSTVQMEKKKLNIVGKILM